MQARYDPDFGLTRSGEFCRAGAVSTPGAKSVSANFVQFCAGAVCGRSRRRVFLGDIQLYASIGVESTHTVANYDLRFTDVIRVVRDTLPALLCIHSNLVGYAWDAFAAYIAVSPGTRYLIMNSNWSLEDIEEFRRTHEPLQISVGILNMPFTREEFIAALQSASGGVLPKLEDSQQG